MTTTSQGSSSPRRRLRLWHLISIGGLVAVVSGATFLTTGKVEAQDQAQSPTDWASTDYRTASRDQIIRATVKMGLICGMWPGGVTTSAILMRAANHPKLDPTDATAIACGLGAPADATCAQLKECVEGAGETPELPRCEGNMLRTKVVNQVKKMSTRASIACKAMGQQCFKGPVGDFCGQALCSPGETYSCEGDSLRACLQGVSVVTPCGIGMTCGKAPGNGVVDCIGTGNDCEGDRCEGSILHQCMSTAYKAGKTRSVDCASYGLECAQNPTNQTAICLVPKTSGAEACTDNDRPRCDGANLKLCLLGKWETKSCADFGLAGSCHAAREPAFVECHP